MYRVDSDGNVGNMFDDGDPAVPRVATQLDASWHNEVQEELVNIVTGAGGTLSKGTRTQVRNAIIATILDTIPNYSLAKVWGRLTCNSGGSISINDQYNVASASYNTGTGDITIVPGTPFVSINAMVVATLGDIAAAYLIYGDVTAAGNNITLKVYFPGGTRLTSLATLKINFVAFGQQ